MQRYQGPVSAWGTWGHLPWGLGQDCDRRGPGYTPNSRAGPRAWPPDPHPKTCPSPCPPETITRLHPISHSHTESHRHIVRLIAFFGGGEITSLRPRPSTPLLPWGLSTVRGVLELSSSNSGSDPSVGCQTWPSLLDHSRKGEDMG